MKFNKFGYLIQAPSIADMIETRSSSDRRLWTDKIVKDPTKPLHNHDLIDVPHFCFLFIYSFLFFFLIANKLLTIQSLDFNNIFNMRIMYLKQEISFFYTMMLTLLSTRSGHHCVYKSTYTTLFVCFREHCYLGQVKLNKDRLPAGH